MTPDAAPSDGDALPASLAASCPATLPGLLAASVAAWPDRPALITAEQHISYAELDGRVRTRARALVAAGAGKGTRVALLMENDPEWVVTALATAATGAVLVPVSTFATADDLAHLLRLADVAVLITSARFLAHDYLADVAAVAPGVATAPPGALYETTLPALRTVVVRGADRDELPGGCLGWDAFEAAAGEVPDAVVRGLADEVDPEDDAYVLTTSGTTARPKGVVLTHRALARNGHQIGDWQGLVAEDVVWAYFPLFFSAGCVNVTLGTLSHGAALIVQPSFDAGQALELIEREGATTWHLWPHQLAQLTEHPDWQTRDHSRLHKGTGPYDLFLGEPAADGAGGVNMYGMTETATAFSCTRAHESPDIRLGTQGHLLPENEMKVVDPETGERLPDGEPGELCVKGPTVMRRYLKVDPARTFDVEGFFHTGDLGWIDPDGRVRFDQRLKDVIKTGGINVSPADVEATLGRVPGVGAAHVFALPDPAKGEVVGAALVADGDLDPETVTQRCHQDLAGYKRPRAFLVLGPDQVPMTGSGKVQKFVLRDCLVAALAAGDGPFVHLDPGSEP